MSAKEAANGISAGLRLTSNVLLLISGLGLGLDCASKGGIQARWGLPLVLACLLRLLWLVFNTGARVFEAGCYHREEQKAWKRIAEDEKRRGLAPVGWMIGRLGCDAYGLFLEQADGSRRRDL